MYVRNPLPKKSRKFSVNAVTNCRTLIADGTAIGLLAVLPTYRTKACGKR